MFDHRIPDFHSVAASSKYLAPSLSDASPNVAAASHGIEHGAVCGVDDWWGRYEPGVLAAVAALWGKSAGRAGGVTNLLLSHMLDTAAVAELVWDRYLAPVTRWRLDELAGGPGQGRRFFAWLCGIHDCGKATPAFQHMDPAGARAVLASGLTWDRFAVGRTSWRHDKAGGKLIRRLLTANQWDAAHIDWVWPLIAGHHGKFPTLGQLGAGKPKLQGQGPAWEAAQDALVELFSYEVGYTGERPLQGVQPQRQPSRALQLQLSGLVVMCDWIASDERYFSGVDDLSRVRMPAAQDRASAAWSKLGLRGGWGHLPFPSPTAFADRFGAQPRDSQRLLLDVAGRMSGPGLLVVEGPMGEGKTKAALAAVELIAARFGVDGVFVGMPTQATSDPMFSQVRKWLEGLRGGLEEQVALLHGKRMFNREWRGLLADVEDWSLDADACFASVGEDEPDEYGMAADFEAGDHGHHVRRAPAEWFLGRRRGLLSPFAVGTIDQLLFTATRTKHVMLRAAGLAGKVVVLDEVHAADVYMSQFLKEGLWWLGQGQVPVLLLSATLPPSQRRELVAAYLAGARSAEVADVTEAIAAELAEPAGYPSVTAAWLNCGKPQFLVESTTPWRSQGLNVQVEMLPELPPETQAAERSATTAAPHKSLVELLSKRLGDRGCALVIRNTVARAQDSYEALRKVFGADVQLLHGRLHAGHRAERTEECLKLLGPPGPDRKRPGRLIVVATQLAEQSFDVDADLLVTDLAPIDLLLQRIGRLHRHDGVVRPERLAVPAVVVTGFAPHDDGPPSILPASEAIYGRYLLLRTAAQVMAAGKDGWQIPAQVPGLVAEGYGTDQGLVPLDWRQALNSAREQWTDRQNRRAAAAQDYLLTRAGEHGAPNLAGMHYAGAHGSLNEGQFEALVRDGERSVEVVLVRYDGKGPCAVSGRRLGPNGEVAPELVDDVLAGTVRLPSKLTATAEQQLSPLPGWRDHPWLRYSRALELDEAGRAQLGEFQLAYDEALGLLVSAGPTPR
ncbi:CRISPR-associated helicase Cas3' [Kitasatospora acidiphila]|uniref:CRISPR-associated helicase Cas3 n=1 Tax=Kitasatospora acidiphila TaxID=2567942 RepID=A0A540W991_9ACTN|nr:CRISPR-associated helicase Cas3' [Kitasatospora acidiphila]TQF05596.1 CRISPR-associated helicase Cas3' [Kitasatospora acidiphila]